VKANLGVNKITTEFRRSEMSRGEIISVLNIFVRQNPNLLSDISSLKSHSNVSICRLSNESASLAAARKLMS